MPINTFCQAGAPLDGNSVTYVDVLKSAFGVWVVDDNLEYFPCSEIEEHLVHVEVKPRANTLEHHACIIGWMWTLRIQVDA